jgi:hypothetical protein
MNKQISDPVLLPAKASSVEDDLDMAGWASELVARARSQGVELAGENGLLTRNGAPGVADRIERRDGRASRV